MSTQLDRVFPDENLPEGAVIDCASLSRDVEDVADFVVVGSGASGATVAYALASEGYDVAILEEGPWVKTRTFTEDASTSFQRMMRDKGLQVLKGRAYMPLIQGRCVGGSTVVNSAIAWRLPEDVADDWAERFGLGDSISMRALEPHFEAIERDLSVRSVDDEVLGENNRLFIESAEARGAHAAPMRRYDRGCKGSGLCLTGCPNAAKQGMNVTYVPWALALRGQRARIYTSCRVSHVDVRGGRAVGVIAKTGKNEGNRASFDVRVRARHGVIVAASTIQTPNVLKRSGVRSRALGRHFQAHPGLAIGALFDRPIEMSFGATQGAESIAFRETERFKLETISMPPELASARIPGVGSELANRLSRLGHVAVWAAQIRAQAEGTVSSSIFGGDKVDYTLTKSDLMATRKALAFIARMMFDAGAREIWPGVYGVPSVIKDPDDVALIEDAPLEPRSYGFIATHLFGAARMGPDPKDAVCNTDFEVHGAERLWVTDSSVFPTNLGVNPQHSIMAMSRLAATRIAERCRSAAAA